MARHNNPAHICCFEAVGFKAPRKGPVDYAAFRAAVLKAGRFSVFEASESPRLSRLYNRLEFDPELKLTRERLGFPWIEVALR
jgi:hypothetical protein